MQMSQNLCNIGDFGAGNPLGSGGTPKASENIDLAFVIDTSGSMGDDIAAACASATEILNRLLAVGTQSFRVAIVTYRDFPSRTGDSLDYPSRLILDFSSSVSAIQTALNSLTINGGGDFPKSVWSGIFRAYKLDWRAGVKKLIIQFGDAPPLDPELFTGYTAAQVIRQSMELDPVIVSAVIPEWPGHSFERWQEKQVVKYSWEV